MNTRRSTTTVAVTLLGLIAVGAAGFGLALFVLGSVASDLLRGSLGVTAHVVLAGIGVLSLGLAMAAAVGARQIVAGRGSGIVIGLTIGAVLVIGPAVATACGGWHPALAGSVTVGSVLLAALVGALRARSPIQGARPR